MRTIYYFHCLIVWYRLLCGMHILGALAYAADAVLCQHLQPHWAGALGWWLGPLPFTPEFGARFPVSAVWKKQKLFLPHPRVKVSIVGSLRDREVACSASDRQGSNFESCVWRTVSSQSSHHPQEVLLAQFSLYVHKGGLKPDSFHFIATTLSTNLSQQWVNIFLLIFNVLNLSKEKLSFLLDHVININ